MLDRRVPVLVVVPVAAAVVVVVDDRGGAGQADAHVVQVLDAALDGDAVAHLDHGGALFGLEEFYLERGNEGGG